MLFMPTKLYEDETIGKGFGFKELKQFLLGALGSIILGLILLLFKVPIIFVVIVAATLCGGSFTIVRKIGGVSMLSYITYVYKFMKTQTFYRYVKTSEWGEF